MKKFAFLIVMLLLGSVSFAQRAASFQDGQVVIDGDGNAVQKMYKIDIAPLDFSKETEAQRFFASINSNLERYKLDYANGVVFLTLFPEHLGKNVRWSVAQWNQYFFERSEHFRKALAAAKSI